MLALGRLPGLAQRFCLPLLRRHCATSRRTMSIPQLTLNETEAELFGLLKDVLKQRQLKSTLRVAGGWVRDKVLGLESDDIDIAIDDKTGVQFSDELAEYLKETKGETLKHLGVIKKNPDQSKHLETVTMTLCGRSIDFVNLRSETYEIDSRIPGVQFGTPKQDAERRDITINALFYNINEDRVEDLTGLGLDDLKNKLVRTPLPPHTTFTDDPLRVLRVIRFATRFGFRIHQETEQALRDTAVRTALRTKVSRERFGIELDKMLHGRDPLAAIAIIVACGLYDVVFVPPEQPLDSIATPQLAVKALACSFIAAHVFDLVPLPADEKRLIFFASALAPFVGAVHNDKKNKSVSTVSMIIRDLVKLPLKDATSICLLHDCAANWQEKVPDIAAVAKLSRREIGLIVRKAGQLWIPSVVFAAAYNLSNTVKITPFGDSYHHLTTASLNDLDAVTAEIVHMPADQLVNAGAWIQSVIDRVTKDGLVGCWDLKPILDGKQVSVLLNLQKGPVLGPILQSLLEWQLDNPNATEDQARQYLLDHHKS